MRNIKIVNSSINRYEIEVNREYLKKIKIYHSGQCQDIFTGFKFISGRTSEN